MNSNNHWPFTTLQSNIIISIHSITSNSNVSQVPCPQTTTPCIIACPLNYSPVCGSDGVTYSNMCFLDGTRICRLVIFYLLIINQTKGRIIVKQICYETDVPSHWYIGCKIIIYICIKFISMQSLIPKSIKVLMLLIVHLLIGNRLKSFKISYLRKVSSGEYWKREVTTKVQWRQLLLIHVILLTVHIFSFLPNKIELQLYYKQNTCPPPPSFP